MAKVVRWDVCFHSNFWLLLPRFSAITLFGCVFTRKSKEVLMRWLDNPNSTAQRTAFHEGWHKRQGEGFKTRWLGFYTRYIGYWIRNLFKYPKQAYRMIPFEREAYENERFDPRGQVSNWKNYR